MQDRYLFPFLSLITLIDPNQMGGSRGDTSAARFEQAWCQGGLDSGQEIGLVEVGQDGRKIEEVVRESCYVTVRDLKEESCRQVILISLLTFYQIFLQISQFFFKDLLRISIKLLLKCIQSFILVYKNFLVSIMFLIFFDTLFFSKN